MTIGLFYIHNTELRKLRSQCSRFVCLGFLLLLVSSCSPLINKVALKKDKSDSAIINEDLKKQAKDAFSNGDYVKSYKIYEKVLSQNPSDKEVLFFYAESLRISGNADQSIGQYNKVTEQDKNNIAAMEGKGLAYLQKGNLENALEQFNAVLKSDVSRWRTINAIGIIYSINGKNDEAAHYYNMALDVSNNNPAIINNIALATAFGGSYEKGIELLNDALLSTHESGVNKQKIENNLALLYGVSGKMSEAEKILRKNLPEAAVYNNLGFYAKIAANKELAWNYLTKAIASSPVYYEKAENNLQDLETSAGGVATNTTQNEEVDKIEAGKAKRGKFKLPLPSLRPFK